MVILLLIILLIVVGSKVIYKDNFAVISGDITVIASDNPGTSFKETRLENIEYPEGFNKSNCALVSFSSNRNTNSNKYYTCDSNIGNNSVSFVTGNLPRYVNLSDKITLCFYNWGGSNLIIHYELVLMKID